MDSYTKLAQQDGDAKTGSPVTNYTNLPPSYSQPQVENKTPMHSRTQPETYTPKKY